MNILDNYIAMIKMLMYELIKNSPLFRLFDVNYLHNDIYINIGRP